MSKDVDAGLPLDASTGRYFTVGPVLPVEPEESADVDPAGRHQPRRPWRVLISHTSELARYPQGDSFVDSALRAVRRAGHVGVEMADWPASDQSPAATSVERVRDCDVYVGVLGFRWGTAVRDDPSRSYVQLEFETAGDAGMPRLVFVLADQLTGPAPPADFFLDYAHGQKQAEFRTTLVNSSGITRVSTSSPQELELQLYQALLELDDRLGRTEALRQAGTPSTTLQRSVYRAQVADIAPVRLIGREDELAELAAFCGGAETYVWWQAGPWAGKTALMSSFVLQPPVDVDVVSFFVTGRLAGQSDSTAFVEAVIEQVAVLLGEEPPASSPTLRDAVRRDMIDRAARRADAKNRSLLLVVDGVDEDSGPAAGHPSVLSLLPRHPPRGLRVLLSGRPHPPVPDDVDEDHPARACRIRSLAGSPYATAIGERAERELRTLLAEETLARDVIGLLVAAAGGLTLHDLHELTGAPPGHLRHVVRVVAGRTLRTRGEHSHNDGELPAGNASYVMGHETLQTQAIVDLGPVLVGSLRARIVAWADGYRSRSWPDGTPRYLLVGYPRMLRSTGQVDLLVDSVCDKARQHRLREETGGDHESFVQIRAAQDLVLSAPRPRISTLCQLAVHRRALADRNSKLPVTLPAVWVQLGEPLRAEALARSIGNPRRQALALTALSTALATVGSPGEAERVAAEITDQESQAEALRGVAWAYASVEDGARAGELAAAIGFPAQRVRTLREVAQLLAAGRASVTEVTSRISDPFQRAAALTAVAQVMASIGDGDRALALMTEVGHPHARAKGLISVARALELWEDGPRAAEAVEAVAALVDAVPEAHHAVDLLLPCAELSTRAGRNDRSRELLERALVHTGGISSYVRRSRTLARIAGLLVHLRDPNADEVVARARATAFGISAAHRRSPALVEIERILGEGMPSVAGGPPPLDEAAGQKTAEMLVAVAEILLARGEPERARSAGTKAAQVAIGLSAPELSAEVSRVLAAAGDPYARVVARRITDHGGRVAALTEVSTGLARVGDFDEARRAAADIDEPRLRVVALTALGAAMIGEERSEIAAEIALEALSATAQISDLRAAVAALVEVTGLLRACGLDQEVVGVVGRVRAMINGFGPRPRRADALPDFADLLIEAGEPDEALAVLEEIEDPVCRAEELATAATRLIASGARDHARRAALRAGEVAAVTTDENVGEDVLTALAGVLARAGEAGSARELASRIGQEFRRERVMMQLVLILADGGRFAKARSMTLDMAAGATRDDALGALAGAMATAGRYAEARSTAIEIGDPESRDEALVTLTDSSARLLDTSESLRAARAIGSAWLRSRALVNVARAWAGFGDSRQASALLDEAARVAEKIDEPDLRKQMLEFVAHARRPAAREGTACPRPDGVPPVSPRAALLALEPAADVRDPGTAHVRAEDLTVSALASAGRGDLDEARRQVAAALALSMTWWRQLQALSLFDSGAAATAAWAGLTEIGK